jgi:hypothetical protein
MADPYFDVDLEAYLVHFEWPLLTHNGRRPHARGRQGREEAPPSRLVYVGPIVKLQGQIGSIQPHPRAWSMVLVQFDNIKLVHEGIALAFGWHEFPRKHFRRIAKKGWLDA